MSDCIFCRIVAGDIPSYKIYEDDIVYAFLDLSQTTKGHTLVIPKEHRDNIFEYDETLAEQVFSRIPRIAKALQKAFPDMKGLNIVCNNGEVAGQTVFHSHVHLIPRYTAEDQFDIQFSDQSDHYSEQTMSAIATRIQEEL